MSRRVVVLPLTEIRRPLDGTRTNDEAKVKSLMESIAEIGQQARTAAGFPGTCATRRTSLMRPASRSCPGPHRRHRGGRGVLQLQRLSQVRGVPAAGPRDHQVPRHARQPRHPGHALEVTVSVVASFFALFLSNRGDRRCSTTVLGSSIDRWMARELHVKGACAAHGWDGARASS